MIKHFTRKIILRIVLFSAFCGVNILFAQTPQQFPGQARPQPPQQTPAQLPKTSQQTPGQSPQQTSGQPPQDAQPAPAQQTQQQPPATKKDTGIVKIPLNYKEPNSYRLRQGLFDLDPPNLVRTIEYDPISGKYVLYERVGNLFYRAPQYLTFDEYLKLLEKINQRTYFKQLADSYAAKSQQPGFVLQTQVRSQAFEQIFGGTSIGIKPQGSIQAIASGQINNNQNPLFNTQQRNQFNFNFDQKVQLNATGFIGTKLKITFNYNTDSQFQFENQIKLDYTGSPDEIVQKMEIGSVSMPLNTTLITGSQALFGIKTKLKFGNLDVTTILAQQQSKSQTITISNTGQQGQFKVTAANYEANKHYFLSQYFRNNYDRALANIPIISSNVNITKIEVWITNRTNVTTGSRDILALTDLGENHPYNTTLVRGGNAYSGLPAGFDGPGFTDQSNSLLRNLPANARLTNDPQNTISTYFNTTGGSDNYAKLTYARQLTTKEFTLQPQLGYISLTSPLNNDEVLAVAYQYSYNGKLYQVGEFSSDLPVNSLNPKVLYVKLLKNQLLKTNLPTWKLMMKNIYSLNAFQISPNNFKLNVSRLDDQSGIQKQLMEEGQNTKSKLWLQLTGLDNLDEQQKKQPDGYFDFLEGVTINSQYGRIIFPVLEPFGSDLAKQFAAGEQSLVSRYVYQPLYDSTQTVALQQFPNLNRYTIQGTYSATGGSEYQLNAVNIPQGSVIVNAGTLTLKEGVDYTIDYSAGTIRVLNGAILSSGQPITVKVENNALFGVQQKTLFGSRFDYKVNDNLKIGATLMHLTEQPITQNEVIGNESISNTIYGFDANYSSSSRFLTKMVDGIPFIHTKVPSSINFTGEFAQLLPGNPSTTNFAGAKNGTVYLDDFENSTSIIDLKSPVGWQISGTPQNLPNSETPVDDATLFNDLKYGYHRARLAFYTIDPIFYAGSTIPVTANELSNHYERQVLQTEVFPTEQSPTGQPLSIPTLDLAFYPMARGPYNYATGMDRLNLDGTFQRPKTMWGGIFKSINTSDFEALNVVYIQFWMMDPFIYKPGSKGGDLYFNLGNISEDILKDGEKSLENALPVNGNNSQIKETVWGKVSTTQTVVNSFDNDPASRVLQDVGLDGMNDADEQVKFANVVSTIKGQLNANAANSFAADPSSDDYQYYQGPDLDRANADILKRYSKYNGTEANSPTSQQSQALLGLQTSAATALPDGEDINHDNNMDQDEEYFQYQVHLSPQDTSIGGSNYITDKITSNVKLANGTTQKVTWYQFRVPIKDYTSRIGGIQDFKSIRYVRMFLTNFADTAVLRMAQLQLVRGSWLGFNTEKNPAYVLADAGLGTKPPLDGSTLDVESVSIFEDANRSPIPYVTPPGIKQQPNISSLQANTKLNEQSLSLKVTKLSDGYSRAAYRLFNKDLRQYKKLNMFIHAEGSTLKNNDISAFVRMGADYTDNFYEYEIPLQVTQPGTSDPNAIWPAANEIDLQLSLLTNAKLARDNAKFNNLPWPLTKPYTLTVGVNKITIVGQPDLSQVTTIMMGVRNPLKTNATVSIDDGQEKSGIVWFDELRLTDFNEKSGWAATGRFNAKLADFANFSVSGSKSTAGFGTLDSNIGNRSLDNNSVYDVSANVELGKFFPEKSGVHLPLYIDVSHQVSAPEYNPTSADILLSESLKAAPTAQKRDSIANATESITSRTSVNLTNIHIAKTDPKAKSSVLAISNWTGTIAYTAYEHHDYSVLNDIEQTYHVTLAYNYTNQAKYESPFAKIIKKNWLTLIRDINFDLAPSKLNYSINFDRFYSENTLRNNDPNAIVPIPTTFNKSFNITRVYGIGWNLTKSLTMDIDATNLSTVDEPAGRLNGLKIDTLWRNLLTLGRTTNYNHSLNFNYNVPLNKIPGMDWTTLTTHYQTHFTWQGQPLFAINDPQFDVGNSINNSREIQINPSLNFTQLYNKIKFLKKAMANKKKTGLNSFLIGLLTSVKNVSATYSQTRGTFIPGYIPGSTLAGEDFTYNSPGIGFLLGSQADLRSTAVAKGWITTDTLQNQAYVTTYKEDFHLKSSLEPIKGLKIELTAYRTQDHTYQSGFKSLDGVGSAQELNPVTTGNYSISYMTIATAFSKISGIDNISSTYQKFLDNQSIISQRLGKANPNSTGLLTTGFADGYSTSSQNVLIPAFLAAYTGKNAGSSSLNQLPSIPIPNWQITYNGLGKIPFLADVFESIDVKDGYRSSYNVSGYTSNQLYKQNFGAVSSRDANNDFLPVYQFSQVTIFEQFVPLLGFDARFKNSMTATLEYRKSRSLSLSVQNTQLAQQNLNVIVIGWGYHAKDFRFPFGWFSGTTQKKDLNFKVDFSLQDNKTLIYQSGVEGAQVSSGAQNITVRPSIDYMISKIFNINFFYDSNITRPYTSQTFNTASTSFGVNMKMTFQ